MDLNMDRDMVVVHCRSRTVSTKPFSHFATCVSYVNRHQHSSNISSSSSSTTNCCWRVKDFVELSILHVSQLRLILSCRLITSLLFLVYRIWPAIVIYCCCCYYCCYCCCCCCRCRCCCDCCQSSTKHAHFYFSSFFIFVASLTVCGTHVEQRSFGGLSSCCVRLLNEARLVLGRKISTQFRMQLECCSSADCAATAIFIE